MGSILRDCCFVVFEEQLNGEDSLAESVLGFEVWHLVGQRYTVLSMALLYLLIADYLEMKN